MPYNKLSELPDQIISVLPVHGQEIYQAAYNNAWEEYENSNDRIEIIHEKKQPTKLLGLQ